MFHRPACAPQRLRFFDECGQGTKCEGRACITCPEAGACITCVPSQHGTRGRRDRKGHFLAVGLQFRRPMSEQTGGRYHSMVRVVCMLSTLPFVGQHKPKKQAQRQHPVLREQRAKSEVDPRLEEAEWIAEQLRKPGWKDPTRVDTEISWNVKEQQWADQRRQVCLEGAFGVVHPDPSRPQLGKRGRGGRGARGGHWPPAWGGGGVGAQGVDGRYNAWRSGAHGPHAHGNAGRQVVDDRRAAAVRGQRKPSYDSRSNQHNLGTPTTGHR